MDAVDEKLTELEEAEKESQKLTDADKLDDAFQVADENISLFIDNTRMDDLNQDQMIRFLDLVREMSWDIPSALRQLCSHLDEDEYYFMHRPIMVIPGVEYGEGWAPADKHFTEVHGWNMDDPRINWSFDT